MTKKTAKVSINQIDKIIATSPHPDSAVVSFSTSEESIDVTVKYKISAIDMLNFIDNVAEAVFDGEGNYMPSVTPLIYNKALLAYYTNIKIDMSNDKLTEIIYNSPIISKVTEAICAQQLIDINEAIKKSIDYKISEQLDYRKQELNNCIKVLDNLDNGFRDLNSKFNDVDPKQLLNALNSVASKSEPEIVNAILDKDHSIMQIK